MVYDIVIDSLYEEHIQNALKMLGAGRLIMDKEDPEIPFLTTEDGFLVVRLRDREPFAFARELERRTPQMRIVTVVDRTPKLKETK